MKRNIFIIFFIGYFILPPIASFGQGSAENITLAIIRDTVEIQYDLTGDENQLYVIQDVTVSEDSGKSFYSIAGQIRGKLGGLKPGKGMKIIWTAKDAQSRFNREDLMVRIRISTVEKMITEAATHKHPAISKATWITFSATAAAGIYTYYARHEANELHDEYLYCVDPGRVQALKDNIRWKDRQFYISLGATTVGAALLLYVTFKHNHLRFFEPSHSRKFSMEIKTAHSAVGIIIKRQL